MADNLESVSLTKSSVPSYLRSSRFLESWDDGGDAVIICRSLVKTNPDVSSADDLQHLLNTLRFWLVDNVPDAVFDFVLSGYTPHCQRVLLDFMAELPFVPLLLSLLEADSEEYWRMALQHGNVDCVRYLLSHGVTCSYLQDCCAIAASAGSVACLALLHQNNFPWDESTCTSAAKHGQLACLTYLHVKGCPWNGETCYESAGAGHVACFMYAFTHGCPEHERGVLIAAANGQIPILQAFLTANSRLPSWLQQVADAAATHGQLDVLKYLSTVDFAWTGRAASLAAKFGELLCLEYLHEAGWPWGAGVPLVASFYKQDECLQYAIHNGCPCNRDAYDHASDEMKGFLARTRGFHD